MKLTTKSGKGVFPIGIGTWGLGGDWEAVHGQEDVAIEGIRYCVSKGQNHLDVGEVYGQGHTEEVIGQAIKTIPREDLFISDKIWETHVAKGLVAPAVEDMLKRLGTNYLDMLSPHKPWDNFPWLEAIPQIDDLIDKGLVRHLGASNLNVEQLKQVQKIARHPIAVNQLHYNVVYKQEVGEDMKKFCADNNIQIIAYKPLERAQVLENQVVKDIAAAHKVEPSQVALAWLLSQGAFPIPQATDKPFIDQNVASVDVKLAPEEIEQLNAI